MSEVGVHTKKICLLRSQHYFVALTLKTGAPPMFCTAAFVNHVLKDRYSTRGHRKAKKLWRFQLHADE